MPKRPKIDLDKVKASPNALQEVRLRDSASRGSAYQCFRGPLSEIGIRFQPGEGPLNGLLVGPQFFCAVPNIHLSVSG